MLNIQQYKVRIKGKVEQSRERSSTVSCILGVVAIEKGAFSSPSTKGRQLYLLIIIIIIISCCRSCFHYNGCGCWGCRIVTVYIITDVDEED